MRSNRASEDWISTDTCNRRPTGKYIRLCSVVNAMMVPAVTKPGPLPESMKPASR